MYGRLDGRPELHDGHPPAARHEQGDGGHRELAEPAQRARGRGDHVDQREGRHDQQGLQHLGGEADADEDRRQREPAAVGLLERAGDGPGAERQQQHEQGVGVVEAEHEGRHRREGQREAGEQAGDRAEPAAHGDVEHADGGDALERLRHEDAPRVDAEEAGRELHDPQRRRRLVDGDEVGGVGGAEEEGLPALGAGLHRGRVEGVGPARPAQADQVEQGGAGQQGEQRRPRPGRVVGPAAPQAAPQPAQA